ncbi:MAG: hypothetical protein JHC88_08800 [Niveispirillum sp.]|nr:hypothetical protein [Niveispirillum sp.]
MMTPNAGSANGPLLTRNDLTRYRPLGTHGRTVMSVAGQIRGAMKRQLPDIATMLAIPQVNETGTQIGWYAPIQGTVVPWGAMVEHERTRVREALAAAEQRIAVHADGLRTQNAQGDAKVFADMLPLIPQVPNPDCLFLVDGQPVLTFWGFQSADGSVTRSIDLNVTVELPAGGIQQTPPASGNTPPAPSNASPAPQGAVAPVAGHYPATMAGPSVTTMSVAPVIVTGSSRPWWYWPLWILGFLLALLLLAVLLHGCSLPSLPVAGSGNGTNGGGIASTTVPADRQVPPDTGTAILPRVADGAPTVTPASPVVQAQTVAPSPPEVAVVEPSPTPPPTVEVQEQPLLIPENAKDEGSVDFLNGRWQSRTSLMDSRTGRPLDVTYDFQNGKGTVTVKRSDGSACTGPMAARMAGGKLILDQTGPAACPDGQSFDPSTVECVPGAGGKAECQGLHGSGSRFQVDVVK